MLRGEGRTPPFRELDRRVRSAIRRDSRADIEQKLRAEGSGALYRAVRPVITCGRSSAAHFLSATPDQLGKHLFCDRQASGPVLQPTTRASGYRLCPVPPAASGCVWFSCRRARGDAGASGSDGICIRILLLCFETIGRSYHL